MTHYQRNRRHMSVHWATLSDECCPISPFELADGNECSDTLGCGIGDGNWLCPGSWLQSLSQVRWSLSRPVLLPASTPTGAWEPAVLYRFDASSGPIYGQITRYAGEPNFLKPKEIVLTFDDGPSPSITRSILAALDSYCAKATFFPVGRMATAYPSVLRDIATRGHTIGAHTWTHPKNLRRLTVKSFKHQIEKGFCCRCARLEHTDCTLLPFSGPQR